jgi:ABC-type uncharacterized transport system involved in gliding motility auxiliary subunit
MKKTNYSAMGLLVLAVIFLAVNLLGGTLLRSQRIDLTDGKLFTLNEGSRQIVREIDEPINLYFFFSRKMTDDVPQLRNYADRVQSLLQEYAREGGSKVKLHIIDPEPFSSEEDMASEFGLQAIPLNMSGDQAYFGLAASNALDTHAAIPFFRPDQEDFLEYDISKLISSLVHTEPPVVGIMSSLQISGGYDMMTQQPSTPWAIYQQLEQLYKFRELGMDTKAIDKDITVLLLVQPTTLTEEAAYAIDQFVMRGGKLIVFVDPFAEGGMQPMPYAPNDAMRKLLVSWGVNFDNDVVGDVAKALAVSLPDGRPVRHIAINAFDRENISKDDVITASLEQINFASAGSIKKAEGSTLTWQPLIISSTVAGKLSAMQFQTLRDPEQLLKNFTPTGEQYVLAARLAGKLKSAFASKGDDYVGTVDNANLMIVADTDVLTDRLWVRSQDMLGQTVVTPWADNGALISNAVDTFAGSSALISVRSRGRFQRSFDVVDAIRRDADAQLRDHEQQLNARLQETEGKLAQLQQQKNDGGKLMLSPEQSQAIEQFMQEKVAIRKQLREVRHQLDRKIEALGSALKAINIALVPSLIVIVALVIGMRRRRAR